MQIRTLCLAGALTFGTAATAIADTGQTIRIPINEWTGQHISAHIAGSLFEKAGFDVEYVTAGAVPQFAAIAQGDLHLQPEVWTNNVGEIYPRAVESGDLIVVGQLGLEPREGWIYPPYMAERCPGLPDYQALFDCAQAFASSDTFPNGRLITYPADWGTRSKELVENIGLPFQPVAGGSEGAMIAEVRSAIATEQPILMMFWAPHWLHAEETFDWVEFDATDGDCTEIAGQTRGDACGFEQASIDKVVNSDFADNMPAAMAIFEALTITNDIQNQLMLEIDQEGRDLDEVIAEWMDENEDTWGPWLEAGMAAKQ